MEGKKEEKKKRKKKSTREESYAILFVGKGLCCLCVCLFWGAGHGFAGDLLAGGIVNGLNFQGVSPPSDACERVLLVLL